MKTYVLTKIALQDLVETIDYIAADNIDMAYEWQEKIETAMSLLAEHPDMGVVKPDFTDKPVRFWPTGNYLIVYKKTSPLEILRILNSYRDVPYLLSH